MSSNRIYIIGAGVMARGHAASIAHLPEPESFQISVTDPSVEALGAFLEAFPDARTFANVDAMLDEPPEANDIVIIATPPVSHSPLACKALGTRRHVLCEKPLAMSRAEAQRMLNVARRNERLIGCCSSRFLGQAAGEAARALVQSGELGELYHATWVHRDQRNRPGIENQPGSEWFLDRTRSGGGGMMDRDPYSIAALNAILEPTRVDVLAAWLATPRTAIDKPTPPGGAVEQQGGATLRYHCPGDATVTVDLQRANCTHGEAWTRTELEGTKGALRWNSWSGDYLAHAVDHGGVVEVRERHFERDGLTYMDRALMHFYQAVQGQPSPAILNEQAVFNLSILCAIYECAETGIAQTVLVSDK